MRTKVPERRTLSGPGLMHGEDSLGAADLRWHPLIGTSCSPAPRGSPASDVEFGVAVPLAHTQQLGHNGGMHPAPGH